MENAVRPFRHMTAALGVLAASVLSATPAAAALLASTTLETPVLNAEALMDADATVSYFDPFTPFGGPPMLFSAVPLPALGQSIEISGGRAFFAFITWLTDGEDQSIARTVRFGAGGQNGAGVSVLRESEIFGGAPGSANGIDLAGAMIERIVLSVVEQDMMTGPTVALRATGEAMPRVAVRIDIFGSQTLESEMLETPLPAAAPLFGGALAGFAAWRRRARRKA